jgi:WD40 repeat protein
MLGQWTALLLTLEGHSARIAAVQFSPDGSRLASASDDGKVIVWEKQLATYIAYDSLHGRWKTAI